jgi:hypothetical protein
MNRATPLCAALMILATGVSASAQSTSLTGSISALVDVLPNVPRVDTASELRLRAAADLRMEPRRWLRVRFAAVADGLIADRAGTVRDAKADAIEAWVEAGGARGDVRAGLGRLPWGRLDELQPADVINPIDAARFILEGRAEARLPVAFLRGRLLGSDAFVLEGVLVPVFRRATFDRLDETTSPFNLLRDLPSPQCPPGAACPQAWTFHREGPGPGSLQGGARLAMTRGRVDWSLSAWRGFTGFPLVAGPVPGMHGALRLVHPGYTMLGADLETVRGKWAWRAEAAWFPDRPMQVANEPQVYEGDSLEAGAGGDRRAGDFTLSATLLFRRTERSDRTVSNSVSLLGGFGRSFSRDRLETRVFALVNPADAAGFLRGAVTWKPVDNVAIESVLGWFAGDGDDAITRFGDRDFGYLRVKYFFGR